MHKQFKPPSLGNCERALYRTSAYSNAAQQTLAITIYNIEYSLKTKDNTTIALNKFHEFHKQNRNGTGTNNEREKKTPTTLKRKTKSIMRTKDNSNHKSDKEESV